MKMEDELVELFKIIGIDYETDVNVKSTSSNSNSIKIKEQMIPREILLSDETYENVKYYLPQLRKTYSSSFMTGLQRNAEESQRWPLLNLVRQLLSVYGYKMEPVRKADGYTLDGVKKYKRYFHIRVKEHFQPNTFSSV
jgi:hypothetical protein